MSMATNNGSTFPNFALCTHFQDYYLVHPGFNQMHSMTLCQHHHKPTLITLWGTPVNAFLYFCRPIVTDSDSSTLAQDTIGIITTGWHLITTNFLIFRDQLHLV